MEEVFTERVYIDPERLIKLKAQRKSLKLVPSIYEPPTDITNEHESFREHSLSLSLKSRSKNLLQNNISNEIMYKTKNANIEFIVGLLGDIKNDQLIELQEGDCLNTRLQERWLILQGEVKITGNNNHSYTMEDGYLFFVSSDSKKKIKEVVCLRQTKILRISQQIYQSYLKNYLFLKNAQKIKYLKYCPFFLWSDQLSQDLASCMKLCTYQRDEVIYSPHNPADQIFFVKEGVVLLERNQRPSNSIIKQYQGHYENNEISENEITLIVKKGMVFGIDGILLKQLKSQNAENGQPILQENNPQSFHNYNGRQKLNTRIYTAKTIGKTELYSIKREILQTLFSEMDLLNLQHFPREMTKGDLQRICADYADMVIKHKSLPKISQAIIRKDLVLEKQPSSIELHEKKINVKKIRFHEEQVKKISIANIITDRKSIKPTPHQQESLDQNASLMNQLNYKLSLNEHINNEGKPFAFPSLSSNIKRRKFKASKQQNMQKYIFKWLKDSDPQREMKSRQMSKQGYKQKHTSQKQKKQFLINVKSYRNIIP